MCVCEHTHTVIKYRWNGQQLIVCRYQTLRTSFRYFLTLVRTKTWMHISTHTYTNAVNLRTTRSIMCALFSGMQGWMCVVSMRAHTNSTTEISAKISRNYRRANFSGSNLKSPEVMRKADTSSREHMSPISKMNSTSAMSQLSTNGPKKFVIVQHNGVCRTIHLFFISESIQTSD